MPRNSERREGPPPKSRIYPATGEYKRAFENDCEMLLTQDSFDAEYFEMFVTSMIHLLGGIKYDDREKWMNSSDESFDAKKDIRKFNLVDRRESGVNGYIRMGMYGDKTAHIEFYYPNVWQDVAYKKSRDGKYFGRALNSVSVPSPDTSYVSYVTGETRRVFPKERYIFGDEESLSDQAMQSVCKNIYAIYTKQSE